jgi:hypothetical protein
MTVEEFCTDLDARLAPIDAPGEVRAAAARAIGGFFGVGEEEVAFFTFDRERNALVFVWPPSLKTVGCIPLSARNCLAVDTALVNRSVLDNSFATTRHLYIYEHFLVGREERVPIQKIMSAAMAQGDDIRGIVQVGRKGETKEGAGPDFTIDDLRALTVIASTLARRL